MLFFLYNQLDAPSRPYDVQVLSDYIQVTESGDVLTKITIVLLGVIGSCLLFRNRSLIKIHIPTTCLVLAYLVWNGMSVFWSTDPELSARRVFSLILLLLFSAGCAVRMNGFLISAFIAAIPVMSLLPGVLAEIRYGTFSPLSSGYRFMGTAPHPNVQGSMLAVAVMLLSWLCWWTRGSLRSWSWIALLLAGGSLKLTDSRTAIATVFIALAFSFALVVARDHRRLIVWLVAYSCVLIGLVGIIHYILLDTQDSSISSLGKRAGDDGDATSLNGRSDLWQTIWGYAAERPWQGYGYGSFWSPQHIEDISDEQGWLVPQAHSAYLEQVLAIGIPGAVLYVSLLLACLVRCSVQFFRYRNEYGAWAAFFVYILVHNLTEGINVDRSFANLAFYIIVSHMALVGQAPQTLGGSENASPARKKLNPGDFSLSRVS